MGLVEWVASPPNQTIRTGQVKASKHSRELALKSQGATSFIRREFLSLGHPQEGGIMLYPYKEKKKKSQRVATYFKPFSVLRKLPVILTKLPKIKGRDRS